LPQAIAHLQQSRPAHKRSRIRPTVQFSRIPAPRTRKPPSCRLASGLVQSADRPAMRRRAYPGCSSSGILPESALVVKGEIAIWCQPGQSARRSPAPASERRASCRGGRG